MTDIRHARAGDLPAIVAIYNAAIPSGMATADLEPVSIASREAWFRGFSENRRPIWVACEEAPRAHDVPVAWLSLHSFYGRAAYDATVEVSVYCGPEHRRRGYSRALLRHAAATAPGLAIATFVAYVFRHNAPSLALFESEGFARWGLLPGIARLGNIRRDLVILGRPLGPE